MPGTHRREPFAEREEPIGLLDLMLGSPRSCLRPLAHGNVAGGDNGSDDAAVFIADGAPLPPPPQTEVITVAPGPLDVWLWVPGCWEWRGRWIWVGGHWTARPYRDAVWVGPHFGYRGHYRVWYGGAWR